MRLIDADALGAVKFHPLPYTHITPSGANAESYKWGWNDAIDAIMESAPTIDPVVHGEWVKGGNSIEVFHNCSICGNTVWGYNLPKYCDECGAKMDGGEQRYEDEFDVCDSRNGCVGCVHHICNLEQTKERGE